MSGKVYITGAGPGDPELCTLKAARVLGEADVVLYDRLINDALLAHARRDCELVYVGKEDGHHTLPQDQINERLAHCAGQGKIVVRLKGGDPFVFGRGGEEAIYLREHGIPFEVIPGVTAAVAVPAYAGIPVTHRSMASTVVFVTGHRGPTARKAMRWTALREIDTIVFMMGVTCRQSIAENLIAVGRDPQQPVAFIHRGTTPQQQVVRSTLGAVAADPPPVMAPAVFVIGDVAALSDRLSWFDPTLID